MPAEKHDYDAGKSWTGGVEQSNITELLMDSGAASPVRPCRMTAGYSCDAFRNATDTQVTSQGMLKAKSQSILGARRECHCDSHDRARCPILSVGPALWQKRLLSSWKMNADTGHTRRAERYSFTSTMVCITSHESELSESCPLEDSRNVHEPPAVDCERDHVVDTRILT